jgi:hypothetical protein
MTALRCAADRDRPGRVQGGVVSPCTSRIGANCPNPGYRGLAPPEGSTLQVGGAAMETRISSGHGAMGTGLALRHPSTRETQS